MSDIVEKSRQFKNNFKRKIWKYSAILSASCLIITFASQFLISPFYQTYVTPQASSATELTEVILFVLGLNVSPGCTLARCIYFYYVMLIINIIEKLIIIFMLKMREMEAEKKKSEEDQKSIKEMTRLENPAYLIG